LPLCVRKVAGRWSPPVSIPEGDVSGRFEVETRAIPARPSEGFRDRELVLGLRRAMGSDSKHVEQPTGRPSVTISGVGPCVSQ